MSSDELAMRASCDISGYTSALDAMVAKTRGLDQAMGAAGVNTGRMGSMLSLMGGSLGVAVLGAGALAGGFAATVNAARGWETSMAGVAKTTGMEGAQLKELSSGLLDMSTRMPVAGSELANIAQIAGSLGIQGTDNILQFTNTAAMMSVGFQMPAEEAATMSAKIMQSFGQPIQNMEKMGNVVNAMGDNFAATEPEVLDFLNRASFLNSTLGQTIPQAAALGTTFISTGLNAELAATGVKSLLNTALDPKKIGDFADLLGVSTDEVGTKLKDDLGGSLITVADNLSKIEDPVERFNAAMNVAGSYGAMSLLKLTGQMDNFRKAQELSNKEWENGSSLMNTFQKNLATFDSQWQTFMDTLGKAGIEMGTVALPALGGLVENFEKLTLAAIKAGEAMYGAFTKIDPAVQGFQKTSLGGWMSGIETGYDSLLKRMGVGFFPDEEIAGSAGATAGASYWTELSSQGIQKIHEGGYFAELAARMGLTTTTLARQNAIQAAYEYRNAFGAAQSEYIKSGGARELSFFYGQTLGTAGEAGALAMYNSYQNAQKSYDWTALNKDTANAIGENFVVSIGEAVDEQGDHIGRTLVRITDPLGKTVQEVFRDQTKTYDEQGRLVADKVEDFIQKSIAPIVTDPARYLEARKDAFSDALYGVFSDFAVSRSEQAALENNRALISNLIKTYPQIADSLGYHEALAQYDQAIAGKAPPPAPISLWDVANTQKNWDKFTYENSALAKVAGEDIMYSYYNALQRGAFEGQDEQAQTLRESWGYITQAMLAPGTVPTNILEPSIQKAVEGQVIDLEMAADVRIKSRAVDFDIAQMGIEVSKHALTAREELISSGVALNKLIYGSPEEQATAQAQLDTYVANMPKYYEGKLKQTYDSWIGPSRDLGLEIMPGWWEGVMYSWDTHQEMWSGDLKERYLALSEGVQELGFASMGEFVAKGDFEDRLYAAQYLMGDLGKAARAAGEDMNFFKEGVGSCGASLSAFGTWQESTPELFEAPYLGAFEGYAETAEANLQRMQWAAGQADILGAAKLGSLNKVAAEAPPWLGGSMQSNIAVNVTGEDKLSQLVADCSKLAETQTITISVNDTGAIDEIAAIRVWAAEPITIPVSVSIAVNAYAEMANIYSMVYDAIGMALSGWY